MRFFLLESWHIRQRLLQRSETLCPTVKFRFVNLCLLIRISFFYEMGVSAQNIFRVGALSLLSSLSSALWISPANLDRELLSSYNYVIIGGGISGIVVANRLTEDPDSMQIHPLPSDCCTALTITH
jgi:hypothetical protein